MKIRVNVYVKVLKDIYGKIATFKLEKFSETVSIYKKGPIRQYFLLNWTQKISHKLKKSQIYIEYCYYVN